MFCPITCIFIARRSRRSKAMSSSVTVGLMTLCTVTCCPCAAAPAPAIPPPQPRPPPPPRNTPPDHPRRSRHFALHNLSPYLAPLATKNQREQQVRNSLCHNLDFRRLYFLENRANQLPLERTMRVNKRFSHFLLCAFLSSLLLLPRRLGGVPNTARSVPDEGTRVAEAMRV